jgi:hypothetical protein
MAACLAIAAPAAAETRTYVLAIGNNAAPRVTDGGEEVASLQYADDDAADFYAFARQLSRDGALLTVLDRASQERFPELLETARPPTLVELRHAVSALRARIEADRVEGHDPVLLFFYSGHGTRGGDRPAALSLLDGPLTQEVLYNEVLAGLPARYVHLFVDACHAESVVRPRDVDAQRVTLTAEDVQAYAARTTLARFPHVGAVVATATLAQAHEWDVYQRGVFTHELMSALRGAGDVNGDRKIEYSEVAAFLSAANREVVDPRARLAVVVHPPSINRRAPIVDLARLPGAQQLVGRTGRLGGLYVEDELGNRLVDLHAEPDHILRVSLPAGRTLFLHHGGGEARLPADREVRIESVRTQPAATQARGALDLSLQRGLFAATYGPRYYRGYVDRNDELEPVPVRDDEPAEPRAAPQRLVRVVPSPATATRRAAWALTGVTVGLTVATAVLGGFGADAIATFNNTQLERSAGDARSRALAFEGAALGALGLGAVAAAVTTWLWVRARRVPAGGSGALRAER